MPLDIGVDVAQQTLNYARHKYMCIDHGFNDDSFTCFLRRQLPAHVITAFSNTAWRDQSENHDLGDSLRRVIVASGHSDRLRNVKLDES